MSFVFGLLEPWNKGGVGGDLLEGELFLLLLVAFFLGGRGSICLFFGVGDDLLEGGSLFEGGGGTSFKKKNISAGGR